jgi:GrpB-like predicted nucleotidyltransferase (UPF0157 family)
MADKISEYLQQVVVGGPVERRPVVIAEYDPAWPERYTLEAARIRQGLGDGVLLLEHVGSTSVPGLAAKPIIDILLVVADSADEGAYVPALEAAGYQLRIREPDWEAHRMLRTPEADVNLHVFSTGSVEVERMLLLRDHLRTNDADRRRYETVKRELATATWLTVQHYADAKTEIVESILANARATQ